MTTTRPTASNRHADTCRADLTAEPVLLDRACSGCRQIALGYSLRGVRYVTRPVPEGHGRC